MPYIILIPIQLVSVAYLNSQCRTLASLYRIAAMPSTSRQLHYTFVNSVWQWQEGVSESGKRAINSQYQVLG